MAYNSTQAKIMESLISHIQTLSWVKMASWEKARIAASEFRADECPVVQIISDAEVYEPQRNDMQVRWRVQIWIVLCSEVTGTVDQYELLEKKDELLKHIGSNYRLDGTIPGLMQIIPVAATSELHMIEPFYIAAVEYEILYRTYYTGPC